MNLPADNRKAFSKVEFVRSTTGTESMLEDERPHVALVGRSNVGKSSTLNKLAQHSGLARTSTRPGKTQEINFFLVDEAFWLVDLPGYGYARAGARQRQKLRRRILWYVAESGAPLKLLVVILDAKVGLTEYDRDVLHIARAEEIPALLLVNKADKLNQKATHAMKVELQAALSDEAWNGQVVFFSARTGQGRDDLIAEIIGELGV